MKSTFVPFVKLGIIILVLAGVLYWLESALFSQWRQPACDQAALPAGHICHETLLTTYGDKVVWIDARSAGDYEVNHLMFPDERMFPIRPSRDPMDKQQMIDAAIGRLAETEERGECIVVFCTAKCTDSEIIAEDIRALDITGAPIYVLHGGWDTLKEVGMVQN